VRLRRCQPTRVTIGASQISLRRAFSFDSNRREVAKPRGRTYLKSWGTAAPLAKAAATMEKVR
jgi:hypothetical protein